jgi:hypothetical protein
MTHVNVLYVIAAAAFIIKIHETWWVASLYMANKYCFVAEQLPRGMVTGHFQQALWS